MKYMLMMHAPRVGWKEAGIGTWPPDDVKAHINFMHRFNQELTEAANSSTRKGWRSRRKLASFAPARTVRPR